MKKVSRIKLFLILTVILLSILFLVNCKSDPEATTPTAPSTPPLTGTGTNCFESKKTDNTVYTCGTNAPVCDSDDNYTRTFVETCSGAEYIAECAITTSSGERIIYYSAGYGASAAQGNCNLSGGTYTEY